MIYFPTKHIQQIDLHVVRHDASSRPELDFSIQAPKEYNIIRESNHAPTLTSPIIDCLYLKSPKEDVEVLVQSIYLQHEVSLENVFTHLAKNSDEKLINENCGEEQDKPDFLFERHFPDNQTWIARKTGYKVGCGEGAFALLAQVAVNKYDYNKHAKLLFAISSSLKPLHEIGYSFAEKLKLVTARYPIDFASYIPYSWSEQHLHCTVEVNRLKYFKRFRGQITGVFTVVVMLATDELLTTDEALAEAQIQYKKKELAFLNNGLEASDNLPGIGKLKKGKTILKSKNLSNSNEIELSFYLGQKKNAWFYVEMCGATKETNFEAWAINQQALVHFIENFKSI